MEYCIPTYNQEKVHYDILCQSLFPWKIGEGANSGKPQKEKKYWSG